MTASSGDGLSNGLIRKVVCVRSSTLRISSGCHRAGVANCDALFSSQHFMSAIIDHNGPKTVETYTAQYVAGSLYVELWYEGEPYAALSVCFPELALADDEFAFKTYSENQSLYQQFLEQGRGFCRASTLPGHWVISLSIATAHPMHQQPDRQLPVHWRRSRQVDVERRASSEY